MLPQNLPHLLEAPVPYVIGVTEIPIDIKIPDEAVIIDVKKDTLKSKHPVLFLPLASILYPFSFSIILYSFFFISLTFFYGKKM